MAKKCIIICAPSGAGKTSITKYVLSKNKEVVFSISACTREKRENEVDGVDYHFLTPEDFQEKIKNDEFVEWEEVYKDQYYGTLKKEVEKVWEAGKNVIFDVDVKGGLSLTRYFGELALAIFIQPPSMDALEERLKKRGTETQEKINRRMEKAKEEMDYVKWFDMIIINDDLLTASEETLETVKLFLKRK